jgi:DNA-3-methyladenine glycosylase II
MVLEDDPEMRKLVEEFGEKRLEGSEEPFKRLVVSIINQQLSTESAEAIKNRVFGKFEIEPREVLEAERDELAYAGLSGQKIEYIRSAAEKFIEDDLSPEKFEEMSDDEVIEELTSIHGVGEWTAKMFMIFVLAREDVFPVEDLGIRQAMEEMYSLDSRSEMRSKAEDWRPERSLAALYLWEFRD